MSFNTLSSELQNIMLVNHNYMTKWFVFISMIFISCFYIWVVWRNHKPTAYVTQAMMRGFFFVLAVCSLLASPMMIINMSPEITFLDWYSLFFKLYSVFLSILFVVVFIDFLKSGIFYVLYKVGGLDLSDGGVKEVVNTIENNKHFLKLKFKGVKKIGR